MYNIFFHYVHTIGTISPLTICHPCSLSLSFMYLFSCLIFHPESICNSSQNDTKNGINYLTQDINVFMQYFIMLHYRNTFIWFCVSLTLVITTTADEGKSQIHINWYKPSDRLSRRYCVSVNNHTHHRCYIRVLNK